MPGGGVRLVILSDRGEEGGGARQPTLHGFVHQVEPRPGGGAICALHPCRRILQVLGERGKLQTQVQEKVLTRKNKGSDPHKQRF